jgi:hypothetical protein
MSTITRYRTAQKPRRCDEPSCEGIKPGDRYQHKVLPPSDREIGNASWLTLDFCPNHMRVAAGEELDAKAPRQRGKRKHSTVLTVMPLESRLLDRAVRDDESGCLRWPVSRNSKGYGHIKINNRTVGVHRVAYEVWIGPIPQGMEIDHVAANGCRHRDCIEPSHLEAVTHAENLARRRQNGRVA